MVFHKDVDSEQVQHGLGEDTPLVRCNPAYKQTRSSPVGCLNAPLLSPALALPLRMPLLSFVVWIWPLLALPGMDCN